MKALERMGVRVRRFTKKSSFRHAEKLLFPFMNSGFVVQTEELVIVEVGSFYRSEKLRWNNAKDKDLERYLRGG